MAREGFTHRPPGADGRGQSEDEPSPPDPGRRRHRLAGARRLGEEMAGSSFDSMAGESNAPKFELDDAMLSSLEGHIPELAQDALRHAYLQALTTGDVLEARQGQLVLTSADGTHRVLRDLDAPPTPVEIGSRRVRKRQA